MKTFTLNKTYELNIPDDARVFMIEKSKGYLNWDAVRLANRELSPKAFTLYIYLTGHPKNQLWALPRELVKSETSLTSDYLLDTAFRELIGAGYVYKSEYVLPSGEVTETTVITEFPDEQLKCYLKHYGV